MPFDVGKTGQAPRGGPQRRRVAVVGAGVSGLSAAWLLSNAHDVVVYEREKRLGGHANTIDAPIGPDGAAVAVDTGFIVFNEANYPNFTALLKKLGAASDETCMSFAVSLRGGAVEYAGRSLASLFARPASFVSPRHWGMLRDVPRFHADARSALAKGVDDDATLGAFLAAGGYGEGLIDDFLKPFAAAIWSTPAADICDWPLGGFLRFFDNHGLLQFLDMPLWNTVAGGSRVYVEKLSRPIAGASRRSTPVVSIRREGSRVVVRDAAGGEDAFDDVVVATHADEALALLDRPSDAERRLLGSFRYASNRAVAHTDPAMMPRRRLAWASWNYLGDAPAGDRPPEMRVTYWMNRLQNLPGARDVFVTLNPPASQREDAVIAAFDYAHPTFDVAAGRAQRELWSLQGAADGDPTAGRVECGAVWYCGSYFGAGCHEDGLQAGLAVAEALGGVRRPWRVDNESGRIVLPDAATVT
ncbi:MAG: NAD(P)/FAD-dependent oxidoreductase [Parvularculaceae bacterium]